MVHALARLFRTVRTCAAAAHQRGDAVAQVHGHDQQRCAGDGSKPPTVHAERSEAKSMRHAEILGCAADGPSTALRAKREGRKFSSASLGIAAPSAGGSSEQASGRLAIDKLTAPL